MKSKTLIKGAILVASIFLLGLTGFTVWAAIIVQPFYWDFILVHLSLGLLLLAAWKMLNE